MRPIVSPWLLTAFVSLATLSNSVIAQSPRQRTEAQWLADMQQAAERLDYAGTIIYQQGNVVRTSRIVHAFDGTEAQERLQMLDGKPREYVRRGDEVRCLYPEARRVQIEQRSGLEVFPALGSGGPSEILDYYDVKIDGNGRVAGIECQVLLVVPKDSLRFGYRLCADPASGLLLKSQTLDVNRDVLEQMSFAEVRIGPPTDRASLKPSWSTDGWRVDRTELKGIDMDRSGWVMTPPSGFRKLKEVTRKMSGQNPDERETMQVVYSDGLASLSVFIESEAREAAPRPLAQGPTSAYSRRVGDALITVIGEVPVGTVRSVAQSVEFRPQQR